MGIHFPLSTKIPPGTLEHETLSNRHLIGHVLDSNVKSRRTDSKDLVLGDERSASVRLLSGCFDYGAALVFPGEDGHSVRTIPLPSSEGRYDFSCLSASPSGHVAAISGNLAWYNLMCTAPRTNLWVAPPGGTFTAVRGAVVDALCSEEPFCLLPDGTLVAPTYGPNRGLLKRLVPGGTFKNWHAPDGCKYLRIMRPLRDGRIAAVLSIYPHLSSSGLSTSLFVAEPGGKFNPLQLPNGNRAITSWDGLNDSTIVCGSHKQFFNLRPDGSFVSFDAGLKPLHILTDGSYLARTIGQDGPLVRTTSLGSAIGSFGPKDQCNMLGAELLKDGSVIAHLICRRGAGLYRHTDREGTTLWQPANVELAGFEVLDGEHVVAYFSTQGNIVCKSRSLGEPFVDRPNAASDLEQWKIGSSALFGKDIGSGGTTTYRFYSRDKGWLQVNKGKPSGLCIEGDVVTWTELLPESQNRIGVILTADETYRFRIINEDVVTVMVRPDKKACALVTVDSAGRLLSSVIDLP